MKTTTYFLASLIALSIASCSKSNSDPVPAPVPQLDITSKIAGVYTITKVTTRDGGPVVTGAGSLTLTAVDKTTARTVDVRSFTIVSTGYNSQRTNDDKNKIAQNGNTYSVKDATGTQWATVEGNKLTTVETLLANPTAKQYVLDVEYTKQ